MPRHWIPASQALSLLAQLSDGKIDGASLIRRARLGLVKTRAQFFSIEGEGLPDATIKPAFWEWNVYAEPEQHWAEGQFSATIDGLRHDAIGVSFDLTGLLEVLPAEKRPELARMASVAGDPAWVTATAARAFMYNDLNAPPTKAAALLLDQCRLGFVAARAVLRQEAEGDDPSEWAIEDREWDVPQWFWECFTGADSSSQDWERGVFAGRGIGARGLRWITLSGVHFAKASLDAMLPKRPTAGDSDAKPAASSAGRPPAAFWDDLWCAIWGTIFRGEFRPNRQAEIETAMLEWATNNGHDLSQTAAKARARKLFAEYMFEGKNL